jgi:hypothetical protein
VYWRETRPLIEYYRARPTFRPSTARSRPSRRRWSAAAGMARTRRRRRGAGAGVIVCRSPAEIERMRAANALVARVLSELKRWWRPA